MGAPDDAGTGKVRSSRLEIITNLAIIATLLFLLLNPSGIVGRWIGGQFAETRERNAVTSLWSELTDSGNGRLGEKDVDVAEPIIVEFLDYQCPACRAIAPHVSKAMEDGSASIVVRHLPLEEIHPIAREAAKAVVCAERQGSFRAAHEALMGDGDLVTRRDWLGMARIADVGNLSQFAECLEGQEADERVAGDLRMAEALGISSTPTFVTPQGIFRGTGGFEAAMEGTLPKAN